MTRIDNYYIDPKFIYHPKGKEHPLSFFFKPTFVLSCFETGSTFKGMEKEQPVKHPGLGLHLGIQWRLTPHIHGIIEYGRHFYKSLRRTASFVSGTTSSYSSRLKHQHISFGLSYTI